MDKLMNTITMNYRTTLRKTFFLLCLMLLLAVTSTGCSDDRIQEELHLFAPLDGIYWGMELEEVKELLDNKGWKYEEAEPSKYQPSYDRLKVTGDFQKPYGLEEAEELYLFSLRGLLCGGNVILSENCDANSVKESLVKQFGSPDEDEMWDSILYFKNSAMKIADFPDVNQKFMDFCFDAGERRDMAEKRANLALSSMNVACDEQGRCLILFDAQTASYLGLLTQGDVKAYVSEYYSGLAVNQGLCPKNDTVKKGDAGHLPHPLFGSFHF